MKNNYSLQLEQFIKSYSNINEDAVQQQIPQQQTQQQVPAAAQEPQVQQQPMQEPEQQATIEPQENVDSVGMSEIQELSGQLAQMLRDFKASNQEQSVEASKFAAGMVLAAAIDGLSYDDRKDIVKKVKIGGSLNSGEGQDIEQPAEQEQQMAESIKSHCEEDDEDIENQNKVEKTPKDSPFSGSDSENEIDEVVNSTSSVTIDAAEAGNNLSQAVSDAIRPNTEVKVKYGNGLGTETVQNRDDLLKSPVNTDSIGTLKYGPEMYESVKMTVGQFKKICEMSNKSIIVKKGQLNEMFKNKNK